MIQLKRAYEKASRKDGYRVLVDRLWPRGVKKENLKVDEWPKEIAPSTEARQRFGHKAENWKIFSREYKKELRSKEARDKIQQLAKKSKKEAVTLVYAAKDETYNHAQILKQLMEKSV